MPSSYTDGSHSTFAAKVKVITCKAINLGDQASRKINLMSIFEKAEIPTPCEWKLTN